jgi:two-component system, cell cycle response regulator
MDKPGMSTRRLSTLVSRLTDKGGYLVRIYPVVVGEGIIHLRPSTVIIGREVECDIALNDHDVSRQHASIAMKDGDYVITDLGSTNGTLVNNEKVSSAKLTSGDLIRIGKQVLKFLRGTDVETQYHETVYSMMINDGLTGIPNKRYLQDAVQRELTRSQRHKRPLSLAALDIDHFKAVNDQYGHLAGDAVLRELSRRIRGVIRKDEVFARYGGEEFVVLLPEAKLDEAAQFAERIRALVAGEPVNIVGSAIPVTISIGISHTSGEQPMTPEELFAAADSKLYQAKAAGRNRVVV